jgi:Zn-dependent protease with chaperone function
MVCRADMRSTLHRAIVAIAALALAGCAVPAPPPQGPGGSATQSGLPDNARAEMRAAARRAADNFVTVVERVEPVAERVCEERTRNVDCDFRIYVDDRPGVPPNAFQTIDPRGRPAIVFSLALIADARNQDELAFILGHEAAHHIEGHIPRSQASAELGALILGGLAEVTGQGPEGVDAALRLGAEVGARRYARDFELEADALGTVIAHGAGYDPVRGAAFFARIPDPGDRFLGTHPPNAERIALVRRVANALP